MVFRIAASVKDCRESSRSTSSSGPVAKPPPPCGGDPGFGTGTASPNRVQEGKVQGRRGAAGWRTGRCNRFAVSQEPRLRT